MKYQNIILESTKMLKNGRKRLKTFNYDDIDKAFHKIMGKNSA